MARRGLTDGDGLPVGTADALLAYLFRAGRLCICNRGAGRWVAVRAPIADTRLDARFTGVDRTREVFPVLQLLCVASLGCQVSGENERTTEAEAQCLDDPPSLRGPDTVRRSKSVAAAAGLLSAALLLVAVAATAGGGALLRSHAMGWLVPAAFVTGAFFFISSVVVPLGMLRESAIEAHEKETCRTDFRDLLWALSGIRDRTLKGLAWINFKQLRTFSTIAQKQARMSYYASLVAASIALLTLTSGAALTIGLSAVTAKVTVGALATAGSVLSGFLAKTFLESYQVASRQMSYYYGQPLVHCYLLHAQWLASEAHEHEGNKTEFSLWQKVVDASINAGASAQEQLLSMQEPDHAGRGARSARRRTTAQSSQASQQPPPGKVESLPTANHQAA